MPATEAHKAILEAVVARIQSLDLDGTEDRVSRRLILNQTWAQNSTFPCVAVSAVGCDMPTNDGDLRTADGIILPVTVRILDRDVIDNPDREDDILRWRELIRSRLRSQRITTGKGVWLVTYQGGPVIEELPAEYKLISSPLLFGVKVLEPRVTS